MVCRGFLGILLLPVLVVVFPLYLAWLVLFVLVAGGLSMATAFRKRSADRRLRRRLASVGRVMELEDLEAKTGGTILIETELACGGPTRVWWTADRVEAEAPPIVAGDDGSSWLARQSAVWSACEPYVQDGPRGATLIGLKPERWESLDQRAKSMSARMNMRVLEFYSGLAGVDDR